ncbi:MAG: DMT family transporter, partial [Candidatus Hodarchaeales archaeon]
MANEQIFGVILSLGAACAWGFSAVLFKIALSDHKLLRELLFSIAIRGLIAVPLIGLLTLIINGIYTPSKFAVFFTPDLFPLIILSSIFVTVGDVLFFGSLQRIEVSKAQPVSSVYPLFTAILLILSGVENISIVVILGIVVLVLGIGLVTRKENSETTQSSDLNDLRIGLTLSIAAAFFWSFGIISVRLILDFGDIDVFALATVRFGFLTIIVSVFWIIQTFTTRKENGKPYITSTKKEVFFLGIGGVLAWGFGAISFFIAIELIGAARATPISSINPVIAILIGILVLKEK